MALKRMFECDGCGKTEEMSSLTPGWLAVQSLVGTVEQAEALYERTGGNVPHGEFCSYTCLGGWSYATGTMASLEAGAGVAEPERPSPKRDEPTGSIMLPPMPPMD